MVVTFGCCFKRIFYGQNCLWIFRVWSSIGFIQNLFCPSWIVDQATIHLLQMVSRFRHVTCRFFSFLLTSKVLYIWSYKWYVCMYMTFYLWPLCHRLCHNASSKEINQLMLEKLNFRYLFLLKILLEIFPWNVSLRRRRQHVRYYYLEKIEEQRVGGLDIKLL